MPSNKALIEYDYSVAKGFMLSALFWGALGMFFGVLLAFQLVFPSLNFETPYISFNRLRPLHTNTVTFGFTISGIFAAWYYISQRVLKVPMVLRGLAKAHLWVYNITIVIGLIALALGMSSSKEYAEFPWFIDILVVVWWLMWGAHIFAMMGARREKTLYVDWISEQHFHQSTQEG